MILIDELCNAFALYFHRAHNLSLYLLELVCCDQFIIIHLVGVMGAISHFEDHTLRLDRNLWVKLICCGKPLKQRLGDICW
jgi:hypothetical protein